MPPGVTAGDPARFDDAGPLAQLRMPDGGALEDAAGAQPMDTPVLGYTQFAVVQEGERIDLKPWCKSRGYAKPMVQKLAGSGLYYQAMVLKETESELFVHVPAADATEVATQEWIRKSSDRIYRGSMKTCDWKHKGKGAWAPKHDSKSKSGKAKGRGRKRKVCGQIPLPSGNVPLRMGGTGGEVSMDQELDAAACCGGGGGDQNAGQRPMHSFGSSMCDASQLTDNSGSDVGRPIDDDLVHWFHAHIRQLQQRTSAQFPQLDACGPSVIIKSASLGCTATAAGPAGSAGMDASGCLEASGSDQAYGATKKSISDDTNYTSGVKMVAPHVQRPALLAGRGGHKGECSSFAQFPA